MAKALDKAKVRFRETESLEGERPGTVAEPTIAAAVLRKSHVGSKPIDSAKLASPRLVDDLVAFARRLAAARMGPGAIVDER